jgi:hypothetical protein
MRGRYTNQKRPIEHFGPMLCSCVFSYSASRYSYSYSKRPSIAIRPIGPQVAANGFDQRSASPQFKQPSSTSTVALSTVRRGGLSTSTTKSEARVRTKRSPRTRSRITSIRDAVSGRNKPKTAPWVECLRPPVGSSDRKHSFIS